MLPYIGNVKLKKVTTRQLQDLLLKVQRKGLSAKTIRNIHGVIHSMLDKAVKLELLNRNVSVSCELPKVSKSEMHTLSDREVSIFLKCAQGDPLYAMFFVDLFTGLRQAELIGLTWDCVDFATGNIYVKRQYALIDAGPDKGKYMFATLKNGKPRIVTPPPSVMAMLQQVKVMQNKQRLKAGPSWHNPENFVFTREDGRFIHMNSAYRHLKKIVTAMGRP